jgi:riboflavin kinase/FMN adenylyltransferase
MALHRIEGWKGLETEARGASVALGNFDGVHRGHRQVIAEAAKAAAALKVPLGVVTFEPHPRLYFAREHAPFRLMTIEQQARALDALGVDLFYVLPFDDALARLSDEAFAHEILHQGLGARHVAAGFDISFGAGRTGSPESLRRFGEPFGFGVSIAEPVADPDGEKCSSSAIRKALREGRPERAAALLGRPFAIEGVVVHGDKLGRTIGFPTANIALGDYVRPAYGIYAVRTRLADGREIPGVGYVGRRPTVNGEDERLEVHLLDFDEDIYGDTLETDFVAFQRGDEKFDGLEPMIAQMDRDKDTARKILMPPF